MVLEQFHRDGGRRFRLPCSVLLVHEPIGRRDKFNTCRLQGNSGDVQGSGMGRNDILKDRLPSLKNFRPPTLKQGNGSHRTLLLVIPPLQQRHCLENTSIQGSVERSSIPFVEGHITTSNFYTGIE